MQQLQAQAQELKSSPRMTRQEALQALEAGVRQRLRAAAQLQVQGDRATLTLKGVPAQALAQVCELTWQLRGAADKRQVDNVTAALQHNIGLGGAAVVTAYQRAER